ncbi:hypothetical protein KEM48_002736 [Puccinia striiformis f. sp. tritici PST-130]|nr:hypothetical protein KEM48_002736 [Puccinia striiformis f. sp. tritici PST-130]
MIATIFPRPVDVDVNLNKYQLFQSAFQASKPAQGDVRSIPQAEDHIKNLPLSGKCVNHWLNSREDYAHSGLIDSATGVMQFITRRFQPSLAHRREFVPQECQVAWIQTEANSMSEVSQAHLRQKPA